MVLSRISEYKITLSNNTSFRRCVDNFKDFLLRDVLTHGINDSLAAGFNSIFNHPASCSFHKIQHIFMNEIYTGTARPRKRKFLVNNHIANFLETRTGTDKEIVVKKKD